MAPEMSDGGKAAPPGLPKTTLGGAAVTNTCGLLILGGAVTICGPLVSTS